MLIYLHSNGLANMYKTRLPNRYLNNYFLAKYKEESLNYFKKVESWLTISWYCNTKLND